MSDSERSPSERSEERPSVDVPPSVLNVLSRRIGEAPGVSLHEDDRGDEGETEGTPFPAGPAGRGSYRVLGEIARGGMGVVLRGRDSDLGRDVALKVLNEELAQRPEVVQRFVEEAQIGGQLQHPGIVPVYELGLMADERPYFTMKLVKGRTLAALLAERDTTAPDRRRLVDIFEATCQTVAYAHSRGVIHRDLKPANVMVGAFGEVQVVDWGLAKVLGRPQAGGVEDTGAGSSVTTLETVRSEGSQGSVSLVGSVLGTPAYMPPEQARGQVDRLDERADVFSLGAILCEILTGAAPYIGSKDEVVRRAAQAELDDAFSRLDACDWDRELIGLAQECLVAAPAARPRSAGVLAERIHRHLETESERARVAQIEAAEARVRAHQERKARFLTLGLAASVLIGIVGVGGGWLWTRMESAERMAAAAERERALESDVVDVVHEARLHSAREDWDAALATGERARAMALAGSAGPELVLRVETDLLELERSASEARGREELRRDTELLLDELRQAREPVEYEPNLSDRAVAGFSVATMARLFQDATTARFTDIFRAHGIEVLDSRIETVTDELERRGANAEIAMYLDIWGAARRSAGDKEEALHLLEIAHRVDPDPVRTDLREAVAFGDLDTLQELARGSLSEQPPDTLHLLAVSLARLDDEEGALDLLRRAVLIHPASVTLHRAIADNYAPGEGHGGDDWGRAVQEGLVHAWAALALQPESVANLARVGRLHHRAGLDQRAVEVFEAAVEARPESTAYRLGLAYALGYSGADPERAVQEFRAARAEGSTPGRRFWSHEAAARALQLAGDLDAAIEEQRQALAIHPDGYYPRTLLIELLLERGDLEEAERILRERPPGQDSIYLRSMATGLAYLNPKRLKDSETALRFARAGEAYAEEVLRRLPNDRRTWRALAVARLRSLDHAGARQAAQRSLELADGLGHPDEWFVLAICLVELGDPERARLWYERGLGWIRATSDPDEEVLLLASEAASRLGMPPPEGR